MSNIIENNQDNNDNIQINASERNFEITAQQYQDIYNQITGKTETIGKRYSSNILVDLDEVKQLDHKIKQLCDIHDIIAQNETITVFHQKERKEQFTSFDRFELYNQNNASPTLSIVLKYNFSIRPSKINRPQEYTVTIKLTSRTATIKELEKDAPPFVRRGLIGMMAANTAEVKVEYVDYVLARTFMEAFEEWIEGCEKTTPNQIIKISQKYSYLLPKTGSILVGTAVAYYAFEAARDLDLTTQTSIDILQFGIVYIAGFHLLKQLAFSSFRLLESSIDSFVDVSYIKLNKGDGNLIGEIKSKNKAAILKASISGIWVIALGVISSKLSLLI